MERYSTCMITTLNAFHGLGTGTRVRDPYYSRYPFEAVERSTLSKPATALHETEVVMSVKLSQVGNFFIRATNARITLPSMIKNCFLIFEAP